MTSQVITMVRQVKKTLGLGAVKGIGESAVESILESRRRIGRFKNLLHFASEVDLRAINHKAFECLIKAGCFDSPTAANDQALSLTSGGPATSPPAV